MKGVWKIWEVYVFTWYVEGYYGSLSSALCLTLGVGRLDLARKPRGPEITYDSSIRSDLPDF